MTNGPQRAIGSPSGGPAPRAHLGVAWSGTLLIRGGGDLVGAGEIHPRWERVHAPAGPSELRGGHLRVDDPRPGRHPLDVARAEAPAVSARVLVLEGAR